jgi:hypothetical protein
MNFVSGKKELTDKEWTIYGTRKNIELSHFYHATTEEGPEPVKV